MHKKMLSSLIAITILISGCYNLPNPTDITVMGAATDEFIIDGDVDFYKLDGTKINNSCKTGDFGIFSCNLSHISPDEQLLVVVNGGKIDIDGDHITIDDQIDFKGSVATLGNADKSMIISPMTSKVVAQAMGDSLIFDNDGDLSYLEGNFIIDSSKAIKISNNIDKVKSAIENLILSHTLQTRDKELIRDQVITVTQALSQNSSLLDTVDTGGNSFRLKIVHLNDTHSHLEPIQIGVYIDGIKTYLYAGGYAKIAKYIEERRAIDTHTIALHAGDSVQGTLYYTLFDTKADIETMNQIGIDAMVIGNHEFDKGADDFAKNFATKANFAILGCDINAQDNPKLEEIIKPYLIKEIGKEKIAIVGDSIDSSVISNPGPTIEFNNYIQSAQNTVNLLQDKGVNKILFLTHLGFENDKILAQSVPNIDIIIGGHSHTLLGNFSNLGLVSEGGYPTIVENKYLKTLIITSWRWGEVVGDIDVIFDKYGNITNYFGTPIMLVDEIFSRKNLQGSYVEVNTSTREQILSQIDTMPNIKMEKRASDIEAIIDSYKPQVDKLMMTTIAEADEDLLNVRLPGGIDEQTNTILPNGSMIAPHVALSMLYKAKETGGCDFAIQNAGGVRISIPKGDVTIGEIYTLLPFGNTLVTLLMDGESIKEMLEDTIDRSLILKTNSGSFPYLANAKITIDQKGIKGERIVDFKIKNQSGEWVELNKTKIYKIATNSYIANGGDYYTQMKNAINKIDTGYIDAEIFMEYAIKIEHLRAIESDELSITTVGQ